MRDEQPQRFEAVVDLVETGLDARTRRAILDGLARHGSGSSPDMEWLVGLFAELDYAEAVPPPLVTETIVDLFDGFARGREAPRRVRRFAARRLQVGGLAAAGVRGGAATAVVYRSTIADVILDFDLQPEGPGDLHGQIIRLDASLSGDLVAQLLHPTTEVDLVDIDDLGQFMFQGVSPGPLEIVIASPDVEIVIGVGE